MFASEAERLREILLARQGVTPLLNLGSSTGHFRRVEKPHIQTELFDPLDAAGVAVFHADLKAAEGVDLAGDLLDPAILAQLQAMPFGCVLLANLLEHVPDRTAVIAAAEDIAGPGGLILVTVPNSYPYHADPLDTGYRPTPEALAAAFTRSEILATEMVVDQTYAEHLRSLGIPVWKAAAQTLYWLLIAPARPKSARARLSRWRWYARRYKVAVALVRVR